MTFSQFKQFAYTVYQWFPTFFMLRNTLDDKNCHGTLKTKKNPLAEHLMQKAQRKHKNKSNLLILNFSAEHFALAWGTLMFRGTVVGKHCCIPINIFWNNMLNDVKRCDNKSTNLKPVNKEYQSK
jgi:hypothetical protein